MTKCQRSCQNCQYWIPSNEVPILWGECLRHPPQLFSREQLHDRIITQTAPYDWCESFEGINEETRKEDLGPAGCAG